MQGDQSAQSSLQTGAHFSARQQLHRSQRNHSDKPDFRCRSAAGRNRRMIDRWACGFSDRMAAVRLRNRPTRSRYANTTRSCIERVIVGRQSREGSSAIVGWRGARICYWFRREPGSDDESLTALQPDSTSARPRTTQAGRGLGPCDDSLSSSTQVAGTDSDARGRPARLNDRFLSVEPVLEAIHSGGTVEP
jgi:hypothetical protein